jgi:hypothetical protein
LQNKQEDPKTAEQNQKEILIHTIFSNGALIFLRSIVFATNLTGRLIKRAEDKGVSKDDINI